MDRTALTLTCLSSHERHLAAGPDPGTFRFLGDEPSAGGGLSAEAACRRVNLLSTTLSDATPAEAVEALRASMQEFTRSASRSMAQAAPDPPSSASRGCWCTATGTCGRLRRWPRTSRGDLQLHPHRPAGHRASMQHRRPGAVEQASPGLSRRHTQLIIYAATACSRSPSLSLAWSKPRVQIPSPRPHHRTSSGRMGPAGSAP
jgi:hypothetical protein